MDHSFNLPAPSIAPLGLRPRFPAPPPSAGRWPAGCHPAPCWRYRKACINVVANIDFIFKRNNKELSFTPEKKTSRNGFSEEGKLFPFITHFHHTSLTIKRKKKPMRSFTSPSLSAIRLFMFWILPVFAILSSALPTVQV